MIEANEMKLQVRKEKHRQTCSEGFCFLLVSILREVSLPFPFLRQQGPCLEVQKRTSALKCRLQPLLQRTILIYNSEAARNASSSLSLAKIP